MFGIAIVRFNGSRHSMPASFGSVPWLGGYGRDLQNSLNTRVMTWS
jgi:hypothetical protein